MTEELVQRLTIAVQTGNDSDWRDLAARAKVRIMRLEDERDEARRLANGLGVSMSTCDCNGFGNPIECKNKCVTIEPYKAWEASSWAPKE